MKRMTFHLDISPDVYQRYYQGAAKMVLVTTEQGLTLKFPAGQLQKYISHDGIRGRFEILFDDNNRLLELNKLS